jgi:hypothetical protein
MNVFLCHSTIDSEFVIQVAKYLRTSMERVFYFEDPNLNSDNFVDRLNQETKTCGAVIVFVGNHWTKWQDLELTAITKRSPQPGTIAVFIAQTPDKQKKFINDHLMVTFDLVVEPGNTGEKEAFDTACKILGKLGIPFRFLDDLPLDPHLFSYEKDIIDFFSKKLRLGDRCLDDFSQAFGGRPRMHPAMPGGTGPGAAGSQSKGGASFSSLE